MASSKKTTMAKLNRERKLRERRLDKQAKKDARKAAAAHHPQKSSDIVTGNDRQHIVSGEWQADSEHVVELPADV